MELLTFLWIIGYILLLVASLYRFFVWDFDYFIEQGIPGPEPIPVFGNWWGLWSKKVNEVEVERYRKYGKIYGTFDGRTPNTVIGDPAILRQILIKDFENFSSRRDFFTHNKHWRRAMSNVRGRGWKDLREAISPAFTTGKVKLMTVLMSEVAETMVKVLHQRVETGVRKIDLKSIAVGYTLDVVASCGFGTKTDCLQNPDSPFLKNALKVFASSVFRSPRFVLFQLYSSLAKFMPRSTFDTFDFFTRLAGKMFTNRKDEIMSNKDGPRRNDFLDILLENQAGRQEGVPVIKNDLVAVAQILQFLVAGFESSASVLAHTLNCLALDEVIQDRLRAEIQASIKAHGGILYESVTTLPYLQQCVSETLRLFPPGLKTERLCNRTTHYEGAKIRKGTMVTVPIYAIHHDPDIYKDPELYDPDRFSPEEKNKRDPMTYIPFGEGPRNCIAMKFAMDEIKIALCHVLNEFRFFRVFETSDPPNFIRGTMPILQSSKVIVGIEKVKPASARASEMKQNTAETYL